MKYLYTSTYISLVLFIFTTAAAHSQAVEVDGHLKVAQMDTTDDASLVVVKKQDGTLATRQAASFTSPSLDTTRTLRSDLELTKLLCSCPSLPPAMTRSLYNSGYPTQDLVDFGISPMEMFEAGIPIESIYGVMYNGGLLFYLDTLDAYPFTGIVASASDVHANSQMGCISMFFSGGDGTAIGTGEQNTIDFEAGGCPEVNTATARCDSLILNGFEDWFLPSKGELTQIYKNIGPGAAGNNLNIGGFANDYYWSSSQVGNSVVWIRHFGTGTQTTITKNAYLRVRAARYY